MAPGGGGGHDRQCGVTLVAEGHLERLAGGRWSSAMTDGVGRLGRLRWWCGHAKQGGDGEDSDGEGGFEPDRA